MICKPMMIVHNFYPPIFFSYIDSWKTAKEPKTLLSPGVAYCSTDDLSPWVRSASAVCVCAGLDALSIIEPK